MKRFGLIIGLTVCVLASGTAWAAKEAAEEEQKEDEKPTSPFSWELYGQLPAGSPLGGCRIIRTEAEWLARRKTLGAEGFPVSFSRNMLLMCAPQQSGVRLVQFRKRPVPGEGRLEAVLSVEVVEPKEGEPAAAAPVPLLFHLIEVPRYDGPVRVSFEVSGLHEPSLFQPVEIPAAQ